MAVRRQTKVHNCKYSYLLCSFILLFSEILLLIEFCFIVSLILLISSPWPKYTSLGVMWLYEMYMEVSFNGGNYHGFILWAYKLFRYIDSALADHETLFDGLRFYDKVNVIALAIIVRRLLNIKEIFINLVQLRLFNLDFTDELFLSGEGITNVNLTSKPSRDAMIAFKNYVDVWLNSNKKKLLELRDDAATMEDFRAIIKDYLHTI